MSDFSPISIIKSQAKQHAREHDMKLSAAQEALARQAGFEEYHELVVVSAIHEPHLLKDRASAYRGISGEQFHGSKAS